MRAHAPAFAGRRVESAEFGEAGVGADSPGRADGPCGDLVVELEETRSEPLLSTCAATRFVRVRQYALRSISA